MTAERAPTVSGLRRDLTRFDLTMIAIGSTIGSGIFLTPALIARALPSAPLILGVWVVGGLMALAGALTFAELGGMMPEAGGVYAYLCEAYGPLAGFLYGWAYFLVVNTGGIAALSLAFATYLGYFIPLDPAGIRTAAITGLLLVTFLNVRGVKIGGIFSDVFTLLKLCGILFLILVGLGGGSIGRIDLVLPAIDGRLAGAGALAMVGVLWSYGGWQHASFAAAEAKNPERSVPVAMVTGAVVVVTVYLLTNVAYLMLLPVNQIGLSSRVAAEAMQSVLGPAAGGIIAAAIFVSTFGTAGIYTMTAPRIYFAMAQDGVFFRRVAGIHPRYGTPAFAIVLQTGWAILLVLFWGTFENLISYVVFTDWIFFALAGASVFVFRRRRPAADRPYRTFGYPVTPLFFVGIAVWFVANTIITKPGEAGAGIAFLALGVPVFYFWRRRSQSTHSHDKVKHP